MCYGQKGWDYSKDFKLKELVKDIEVSDLCLILRAKNTGSCLNLQSATVTGTVLAATEFHVFLCACYYVNPPNLQRNVMAALYPSPYVTDLGAPTEDSLPYITKKCVTGSSNSLDNPSPLTAYATKTSSTRAVADHRRGYTRGAQIR